PAFFPFIGNNATEAAHIRGACGESSTGESTAWEWFLKFKVAALISMTPRTGRASDYDKELLETLKEDANGRTNKSCVGRKNALRLSDYFQSSPLDEICREIRRFFGS
ncbi:unnamed protein product, partial [Strongylus vulgaris]